MKDDTKKKRAHVQRLRRKFKKLFGKEATATSDDEIWSRSLPRFSISPSGWKKSSDGDSDFQILTMMRDRQDYVDGPAKGDDWRPREKAAPLTNKEQDQQARDALRRINPKRYAF